MGFAARRHLPAEGTQLRPRARSRSADGSEGSGRRVDDRAARPAAVRGHPSAPAELSDDVPFVSSAVAAVVALLLILALAVALLEWLAPDPAGLQGYGPPPDPVPECCGIAP